MLNTNIARSNLAKLLATENLTVSYKKVETASFNLATRELILPIWNDVTPELYDLLVGHEVGHAKDTPKKYMEDATKGGRNFAHFLNVVEDARIERNIKNLYPGLRKPMAIGYRQLVDRDFFGIKDKNVSSMLLIDRINLYFKVGAFSGATFSDVEQPFIKEIEDVISYEQVADIATRLYAYCKEELKEKEQQAQERHAMKQESGDDSEDDFSSDEDMDQDDDQEPSPVENLDPEDFDDGDQDSTEEDSEESTGSKMGNQDSADDDSAVEDYEGEVKSLTSEALEKNLKGLTETKFIQVGQAPSAEDFVLDEFVIPFKNLSFFEADFYTSEWFMPKMLSEFENKNKNAISYLVKEFELKKKAAELRRVTVADSGTLNTNMLHSYKFNDDIFRKIGSIAAGKNHGIVLFVDWSGSMVDNIQGTIEQLLTLTSFCRKVNIPFDVYAFTTNFVKSSFSQRVRAGGQKDTLELSPFGLMNILSSNMKNQTYKKFANDLLSFAFFQTNYYTEDARRILGRDYIPETHVLGGTPLNATIMVASEVVNAFRAKNKCEIVNVVFLTDGEDNDSAYTCGDRSRAYGYAENKIRITASNSQIVSFIEDKTTRKTYRVGSLGITPTLLTILKDRTQCNLIGFYIVTKRNNSFNPAALRLGVSLANCTGAYAAFCKDKFFSVTNYGYDEYFLIPGGNDLSTEDDSLEDIVGKQSTTARKLKGAFIQMNKGRLLNRVLLSKVIKKLA